jgi:hypothetical protein
MIENQPRHIDSQAFQVLPAITNLDHQDRHCPAQSGIRQLKGASSPIALSIGAGNFAPEFFLRARDAQGAERHGERCGTAHTLAIFLTL